METDWTNKQRTVLAFGLLSVTQMGIVCSNDSKAYSELRRHFQYLPMLEAAQDLLVVSSDDPAGARVALGLPGTQLGGGAAPGVPPGGLGLGGLGEPEEPSGAPRELEEPGTGPAAPGPPLASLVGPAV